MRWLLVLLAALSLGAAGAQSPDPEPDSPSLPNGQAYCKLYHDVGTSAFCFTEYNLLDMSGVRVSLAWEQRFLPEFNSAPLVLVDYRDETWFAQGEVGRSLFHDEGWRYGVSIGLPIP